MYWKKPCHVFCRLGKTEALLANVFRAAADDGGRSHSWRNYQGLQEYLPHDAPEHYLYRPLPAIDCSESINKPRWKQSLMPTAQPQLQQLEQGERSAEQASWRGTAVSQVVIKGDVASCCISATYLQTARLRVNCHLLSSSSCCPHHCFKTGSGMLAVESLTGAVNPKKVIGYHARTRRASSTAPLRTGADMCKTGPGAGKRAGATSDPVRRRSNHEWTDDQAGRRRPANTDVGGGIRVHATTNYVRK